MRFLVRGKYTFYKKNPRHFFRDWSHSFSVFQISWATNKNVMMTFPDPSKTVDNLNIEKNSFYDPSYHIERTINAISWQLSFPLVAWNRNFLNGHQRNVRSPVQNVDPQRPPILRWARNSTRKRNWTKDMNLRYLTTSGLHSSCMETLMMAL